MHRTRHRAKEVRWASTSTTSRPTSSSGDPDLRPPVRVADRGGRGHRLVPAAARHRDRRGGRRDDAGRPGRGVQALQHGPRVPAAEDPRWRTVAEGILFQAGDIVEHGEAAEAEAFEGRGGRETPFDDGSLGIGSLRERRDESSALGPCPDQLASWNLLDAEARERLTRARRSQARRLLGPHGWDHSATNLGRMRPLTATPTEACPVCSGACCRSSSCAPTSPSRARELRTPTAAPTTSTSPARPGRPPARHRRERGCIPWLEGRDHRHRRGVTPRADPARQVADKYPRAVASAWSACCAKASPARTGWRWARAVPPVVETAEHGGYPLLEHLRKILEGPLVWAPGVDGAVVLSLRGGDFVFESGQDLSIGFDSTTPTPCGCTWRRASASTWRRPRRRSR